MFVVFLSLCLLAPPTSPSIDVESVSATSVIIRWNPNQLAPNTDYSLNYASDKNDWRKLKLSVDQATHVVSGLACGTSYRFYVIASNSLGTGEPGVEVQIRTQGRRKYLTDLSPHTPTLKIQLPTNLLLRPSFSLPTADLLHPFP